jgi:glycosyltransferase involved in cell wall biosynthesis
MQLPEISVIMPVYNGATFLDDAIKSILGQTFRDFEFIIINDGSTDNTEEIIRSYNDPRIVYVKNATNLRLIKTLNLAVKLAKGKYIARMDADDISLPNRLEMQKQIFSTQAAVDIVNINSYYLQEDGVYFREQKSAITLGPEAIKHLSVFQNFISHPGVMLKSDLLKHYQYCDEESKEHIEDFDLWNRMLKDGHVCYTIDECLLYYRDNNTSINHTQKDRQLSRMLAISQDLLKAQFDFEIEPETLKFILGETRPADYTTLSKVDSQIEQYFSLITTNQSVSAYAYKEMKVWKKQKIVVLSLRALAYCNIAQKTEVLFYLLRHIHWFTHKQILHFLSKAAYSKYYKRVDIAS